MNEHATSNADCVPGCDGYQLIDADGITEFTHPLGVAGNTGEKSNTDTNPAPVNPGFPTSKAPDVVGNPSPVVFPPTTTRPDVFTTIASPVSSPGPPTTPL